MSGERIAKRIARAGVCSRREAERRILAGRVRLNGKALRDPAVNVGAGDLVEVDGAVLADPEPARLWRYHKPAGLVTTDRDPEGRPTVFESLPTHLPRVVSVGRLDLASEGLLLLTNDGGLARELELPARGWVRRYRARRGRVDEGRLARLAGGLGSTAGATGRYPRLDLASEGLLLLTNDGGLARELELPVARLGQALPGAGQRGRVDEGRLARLAGGLEIDGWRYGAISASLDEQRGGNAWVTVALAEGRNREAGPPQAG